MSIFARLSGIYQLIIIRAVSRIFLYLIISIRCGRIMKFETPQFFRIICLIYLSTGYNGNWTILVFTCNLANFCIDGIYIICSYFLFVLCSSNIRRKHVPVLGYTAFVCCSSYVQCHLTQEVDIGVLLKHSLVKLLS